MSARAPSPARAATALLTCSLFIALASAIGAAEPAANAPAPTPAGCGDGLLRDGETCDTCAADCTVRTCRVEKGTRRPFAVAVAGPLGAQVFGITARLAYRSDRLSLPGRDVEASVQSRLSAHVKPDGMSVRDGDYAVSIAILSSQPLPTTPLLDLDFDLCAGATASADDLACELLGCAGAGGPLTNCTCKVFAR